MTFDKTVKKLSDGPWAVVITTSAGLPHQLDLHYTTNPRARTYGYGTIDEEGVSTWSIHLNATTSAAIQAVPLDTPFRLCWGDSYNNVTYADYSPVAQAKRSA
jgi:hypothetical protein